MNPHSVGSRRVDGSCVAAASNARGITRMLSALLLVSVMLVQGETPISVAAPAGQAPACPSVASLRVPSSWRTVLEISQSPHPDIPYAVLGAGSDDWVNGASADLYMLPTSASSPVMIENIVSRRFGSVVARRLERTTAPSYREVVVVTGDTDTGPIVAYVVALELHPLRTCSLEITLDGAYARENDPEVLELIRSYQFPAPEGASPPAVTSAAAATCPGRAQLQISPGWSVTAERPAEPSAATPYLVAELGGGGAPPLGTLEAFRLPVTPGTPMRLSDRFGRGLISWQRFGQPEVSQQPPRSREMAMFSGLSQDGPVLVTYVGVESSDVVQCVLEVTLRGDMANPDAPGLAELLQSFRLVP